MPAVARQARAAAPAPRRGEDARDERQYAYRAPHTRRRAAQRSRLTRAFVIFVGCLTVLAVGRVALSFAVVQKTLQTDAVVREERRLTAVNAEKEGVVASMASTVRIRHIAQSDLGLVDATHVLYLKPLAHGSTTEVAAN